MKCHQDHHKVSFIFIIKAFVHCVNFEIIIEVNHSKNISLSLSEVWASCGADVKSSKRCALYKNGWTDPTDSTGVSRQQHGVRTQNSGDAIVLTNKIGSPKVWTPPQKKQKNKQTKEY